MDRSVSSARTQSVMGLHGTGFSFYGSPMGRNSTRRLKSRDQLYCVFRSGWQRFKTFHSKQDNNFLFERASYMRDTDAHARM